MWYAEVCTVDIPIKLIFLELQITQILEISVSMYIHTCTYGRLLARFDVLKPQVCDLRVYFSLLRLPNICIYVNMLMLNILMLVWFSVVLLSPLFMCEISLRSLPHACWWINKHLVADCVPAMLKPVSRQSCMTSLSEGSRIWKCVSTAHPGVLSV